MIKIHQATYGETDGHGLINTSHDDRVKAERISGYTDLADRPEGGRLSAPIIRGMHVEDQYLLIKSFPTSVDESRGGRIFSHALMINVDDLDKINDITELFKYFTSAIDYQADMNPIDYLPTTDLSASTDIESRAIIAVNGLFEMESHDHCISWIDERGYWDFIRLIWKRLPSGYKEDLRLGVAFNPRYIKNDLWNLVYIPKETVPVWSRENFLIINHVDEKPELTSSASWLIGQDNKDSIISKIINDFQPNITDLSELARLESMGKIYPELGHAPDLRQLLVFSAYIATKIPNKSKGVKGKSILISKIKPLLENTKDISLINALIYQTWKGYRNGTEIMEEVLSNWLSENLFESRKNSNHGSILVQALKQKEPNWWTKTVLNFIIDQLDKQWKNSYGAIIWNWMVQNCELIELHNRWLPNSLEPNLVIDIPKLKPNVYEAFLALSKEKNWLEIHGIIAVRHLSTEQAITRQLSIDTDPSHTKALEAMSAILKWKQFVDIACSCVDVRMHHLAAEKLVASPKLLENMDLTSEASQRIWEEAVKGGMSIWGDLKNEKAALFRIMDWMMTGGQFSLFLLKNISKSGSCSMMDYERRSEIWNYLPKEVRSTFIHETAIDSIRGLQSGKTVISSLEKELQDVLKTDKLITHLMGSLDFDLDFQLGILESWDKVNCDHAMLLINNKRFSSDQSSRLGVIVKSNKWKTVANHLYESRKKRSDLLPSLDQCTNLLSFRRKWKYENTQGTTKEPSVYEQWKLLREVATILYPEGPTQNGLWERAGGDVSNLVKNGTTGKQIWIQALLSVRNGSDPAIIELLNSMLEDFPNNEDLTLLKRVMK